MKSSEIPDTPILIVRTEETLKLAGLNPKVSLGVNASGFPASWAIFFGLPMSLHCRKDFRLHER